MCKCLEDHLIQCPYYRCEEPQTIHCEGVTRDTGLHLTFGNRVERNRYKAVMCREDWKKCMVAGMLNRKYDYEP